MICNEDTCEEPVCEICGNPLDFDCGHLVADLDRTFDACEGGVLFDNYLGFSELLDKAFSEAATANLNRTWSNQTIQNAWLATKETSELQGLGFATADSSHNGIEIEHNYYFWEVVTHFLREAGAIESKGPLTAEGGPGDSSIVDLFFSANPQHTAQAAINLLCTVLERDLAKSSG